MTFGVDYKVNMKDLIEYIAKSLVDHPEDVIVTQSNGNRPRIELSVAKEDMGRVIGKGGKVANSIRALLRVASERQGKQATLDVTEPS
ncbi:MAG: KH domain-containing protein [Anaerolineaceae bacterium]|nr:MAG: KH domain-containing protein [Anaerolineaceae bacterium]